MLSAQHFRDSLLNACHYTEGAHVLVAVSGGLDSVVLAHLFAAEKIPFAIAHVNYGLRGTESEGDEQYVAQLAGRSDVPLFLKKCSPAEIAPGNSAIQETARDLRYDFFRWVAKNNGYRYIATAHHLDDSIETVLMNLFRGTGLNGLTGIDAVNGNIIRPLLSFTREAIEQYARENHLSWREDASNSSDVYTRNKFRHHILPRLLKEIPQGHAGFEKSMQHLRAAQEVMAAAVAEWEKENVVPVSDREVKFAAGANELQPLLRAFLSQKGFNDAQLEQLMRTSTERGSRRFYIADYQLVYDRGTFYLSHGEFNSAVEGKLSVNEIPAIGIFPENKMEAIIDAAGIEHELVVRRWHAGEKMIPYGMKGSRLVSDILNEMKIPAHRKENTPVVAAGDEIVWIPGFRIAHRFRVTGNTSRYLHLKFTV